MTSKRVLIVDDDFEFRSSVRKIFQREGFQVSEASNGFRALTMLEKAVYPVIVLDLNMPGKSGWTLLSSLKMLYPKSKIIVLTVGGDSEVYTRVMNEGAFAFLNKPVKRNKLLSYTSMAFC